MNNNKRKHPQWSADWEEATKKIVGKEIEIDIDKHFKKGETKPDGTTVSADTGETIKVKEKQNNFKHLLTEIKAILPPLDVSHNPKLTDLFIPAELFVPENKIIGLEKTSIIRLDCQKGNLLKKSQDPQFIWDVFIRKYNTAFPEMELINVNDLTEIAQQVNSESIKDKEFLKKFCSEEFLSEHPLSYKSDIYWILDNLANQILARCLIVQNRLYTDEKDEEYEKHLIELAQDLQCKAMNPKYPQASLYSNRERLVNQAINGDQELLKRLQDLEYLNPKYKLEK